MLSRVIDLEKIKESNIQHTHTGTDDDRYNFIMTELSLDENLSSPQIKCENLKENSLLLQEYNAYDRESNLIEIGMHKFMLGDLIIDQFEVVGKVQMPDGVLIIEPILTPLFDPEKFPYVIAMGAKWSFMNLDGSDYFMLNIKQKSSQVLVKAKHNNGPFCCIQVGENAFDLHFSSWKEE